MKNNIEGLNEVLFDTLKGLNSGDVSVSKAKAIVDVSTAITKNASLQLQAFKLSKGKVAPPSLLSGQKVRATINSNNKHEQMTEFAVSIGYDNVTEAIGDLGKFEFETKFKKEFS